ncbi:hypothetical protein PQX77_002095 [Marasmius sp. AFHP31]|nr:hypothetical protein PQX77_002095 [Marasmius sp. AFHP31]
MPLWGGEVGEELTSKNFLKRAEGWLVQTQKNENDYTKLVRLFYKDGSRAEKWHEELEKGDKDKGWEHYSELLLKEFPTRVTVTKKTTDYIQELHALRLGTEGLDVKNKEKNQWPHQKFTDDFWELSVAAGISNTPSDIYSIHKELPKIFHTLVSNEAENWKDFTDELRKVDIKVVKEKLGTARAIEELKEKQTTLQTPGTPTTRLANSFNNVRIGQAPAQPRYRNQGSRTPAPDPFASNGGGRGNLFQGTQYRQPQQQQATYQQPAYQQPLRRVQFTDAQKETLKANVNGYEQKPDTPEGKALWRQDLIAFTNQWGRAPPNENMPWKGRPVPVNHIDWGTRAELQEVRAKNSRGVSESSGEYICGGGRKRRGVDTGGVFRLGKWGRINGLSGDRTIQRKDFFLGNHSHEDSHVQPSSENTIDVYSVQQVRSRVSEPFRVDVELIDGERKATLVCGMIDDGAMVVGLSKQQYERIKDEIGGWGQSKRWMRMADGALVPGVASWQGVVRVKGLEMETALEVFDSGGQWDFLFGKPLLKKFGAVHDYEKDTIVVKKGKEVRKIFNEGLGKQVEAKRKKKPLVAKVGEVVGKVEDARPRQKEKACNHGGVTVNTEAPREREVLVELPFEGNKIPTHENTQNEDKKAIDWKEIEEKYREWRREEAIEKQDRLLERKRWIKEWEELERKWERRTYWREWRGKAGRRWRRWKSRNEGRKREAKARKEGEELITLDVVHKETTRGKACKLIGGK